MVELLSSCYYSILLAVAVYFFLLSLANHFEMWRFTQPPVMLDGPLVSVCIPARNEEANIGQCVASLLDQHYKNYEILVIDDNSTDKTPEILERLAAEHSQLRVFKGAPLPEGWFGKPFAMHQVTQQARGEILLFTDADTRHKPTSISWAVTNLINLKADMVSGWVEQAFLTFGEAAVEPVMYLLTGFVVPLFLNRFTRLPFFSCAIGQFIAIKREVFECIGGYGALRKKINDDIYMARYVKNRGFQTRFLDIGEHVQCRMFKSYRAALAGLSNNVFDFLGKNPLLLFLGAMGVMFFLFLPLPMLFVCLAVKSPWTPQIALVNLLFTLTWLFLFLCRRLDLRYTFVWPLIYLNLFYMAMWGWFRAVSGKDFLWKDRVVT